MTHDELIIAIHRSASPGELIVPYAAAIDEYLGTPAMVSFGPANRLIIKRWGQRGINMIKLEAWALRERRGR